MQPIPFELPLKANEAAMLADLLFDQVEGRALTDDARNRLASRIGVAPPSSFTVFAGSLQRDPIHPSVYYIAVDASRYFLLRIALSASPSSGLFPNALLIGRMRTKAGREVVVNAIPFAATDRENIRTFVDRVDRAFLPRPQGTLPGIEIGDGSPAPFQAFRSILKSSGLNVASMCVASYEAALLFAIVSGWREGYTVAANVIADAIEPGFTKYNVPESRVPVFFEAIQKAQVSAGPRRRFDFELSLAAGPTPTTPKELFFHLDALKAQNKPVQLIAASVLAGGRVSADLPELVEVARSFNVMLSIQLTGSEPPEVLEQFGKATGGRVNCKIPGGCDPADIIRLAGYLRG